MEDLLQELPTGCIALAMFGWKPPELSPHLAFERCAWPLRRRMPATGPDRSEITDLLCEVGLLWLEADEVEATLRAYRLPSG